MKIKIWTGLITLVLSVVLLRYYITQFQGNRETAVRKAAAENAENDESVQAVEEEEKGVPTAGKDMDSRMIRVLLKTDDFAGVFHKNPKIRGSCDFWVEQKGKRVRYEAGAVFSPEQELPETDFTKADSGTEDAWTVGVNNPEGKLEILDLKRSQSPPAYGGTLEVTRRAEGYVLINELPLEEYLTFVLSSEMSSSFPAEALKAQAISARTYAIKRMQEENVSCYGADLDDSVSYQVYNNVQSSKETRQAVEETRGQVLTETAGADLSGEPETAEPELADVFYYSTSCGASGGDDFRTEEEFREFIENGRKTDMEREEVWYRWHTEVSAEKIRQNLLDMELEPPERITGVRITKREANGRASMLEISGEALSGEDRLVSVEGEYDIRRALAPEGAIWLRDGSSCDPMRLLPSAWFVMDEIYTGREQSDADAGGQPDAGEQPDTDTGGRPDAGEQTDTDTGEQPDAGEQADAESGAAAFRLIGGGFGHGNGLSQNGAACMARQGRSCQEILEFYYPETQISGCGEDIRK